MTTNDTGDPLLRLLSTLPLAAPPPAFDRRVRSRCYVALAARPTPSEQRSRFSPIGAAAMNAALVVATFIYAAATGLEAPRLAGIL
jgi:hypothetical protein